MNEILDALYARKSMRAYTGESVSTEKKELILKAACAAPTAGNQQLYTILDITDQHIKDKLAVSCDNQPFIAEAEIVLIFCADCQKWYDAFVYGGCEPRLPRVGDLMLALGWAPAISEILWNGVKSTGSCSTSQTMCSRRLCS